MSLFGKKNEGGLLDTIRCDEHDYLIWKWRPSGGAASTRKENAIRWGSTLRVKDGEVAVFVYQRDGGVTQDYIEGPFDETLKTANLPILADIIGLAYAGQTPFQAEVYFINLAGIIKVDFRTQYFDVFDPRFLDFPVRLVAEGSYIFNITDYKNFIKLHRLINFDLERFVEEVRNAVTRYVKTVIANAPANHDLPVLQLGRKLEEISTLIHQAVATAFATDFGVNLKRLDLSEIEVDKDTEEYRQLRQVTADLEIALRQKQNEISMRNLDDTQSLNRENLSETMRIQRDQAERLASLQTQTQYIGAHQINQQTEVLRSAAESLGSMGQVGGGGDGNSAGGFNPVGIMSGLAISGAMAGQMAGMMNASGQNIAQTLANSPPPPPPSTQLLYHALLNGQAAGPFTMAQLQELVRTAQLSPAGYVWKVGMADWALAGNVAELNVLFAVPPPPPASTATTPPPPPPSITQ